MSETIDVSIAFDVPYVPENLQTLLFALTEAVADNWRRYHDNWSDPEPHYPVGVDVWLDELVGRRFDPSPARACDHPRRHFYFPFSPLSWGHAILFLRPEPDGTFAVLIAVPSNVQFQVRGTREMVRMDFESKRYWESRGEDPTGKHGLDWDDPESDAEAWCRRYNELDDTESVWPQNRESLLRVIRRLVEALPTRKVEIPEVLREGPEEEVKLGQ